MTKHAESKERQGHLLGEENSANVRWHVCKRVSYTSYNHILKWSGPLDKWNLLVLGREIPLVNELDGQFHCYRDGLLGHSNKAVTKAIAYREMEVLVEPRMLWRRSQRG
jgi:hypothetical protein